VSGSNLLISDGFNERVHFVHYAGEEIGRQHLIQCGELSGEGWQFK
jgi:hypothetical protein